MPDQLPPLSDPIPRWQLLAVSLGLVAVVGPWLSQLLILGSILLTAFADSR